MLKYNFDLLESNIIISLSGGVDSMVLTNILLLIKIFNNYKFNIIAIHLNYNNRQESILEQAFIEEWCEINKIKLYVQTMGNYIRGITPRNEYEEETKKIRYDTYLDLIKNLIHLVYF